MAYTASPRSGPRSPGQAELGEENYNSQQHLQRPQRPGFPPDRGQVAILTGAPGADRKERKAKAVIKHSESRTVCLTRGLGRQGGWGDGNKLTHTQERGRKLGKSLRGILLQTWSLQAPEHLPPCPVASGDRGPAPPPPGRPSTSCALPATQTHRGGRAGGGKACCPPTPAQSPSP